MYLPNVIEYFTNPISIHEFYSKNNLSNIEEMIPLYIFVKPGIVENIHIGVSFSPFDIETDKALIQYFHDVFA